MAANDLQSEFLITDLGNFEILRKTSSAEKKTKKQNQVKATQVEFYLTLIQAHIIGPPQNC